MVKTTSKIKDMAKDNTLLSDLLRFMAFLLMGSIALYVLSLAYYSVLTTSSYYAGTITVSGHGEVEVKPDISRLSIEIFPTPQTATKKITVVKVSTSSVPTPPSISDINSVVTVSNDLSKKVVALLKSKGVNGSDIDVQSPGFISVKLRGKAMTDQDNIVAAINKISSREVYVTMQGDEVEFPAKAKARALEAALVDAKANAKKISQSLDSDLGKVTSFYDNSSPSSPQYSGDPSYGSDPYSGASNDSMYPSTGMTGGNVKVVSDVSVTYQVR